MIIFWPISDLVHWQCPVCCCDCSRCIWNTNESVRQQYLYSHGEQLVQDIVLTQPLLNPEEATLPSGWLMWPFFGLLNHTHPPPNPFRSCSLVDVLQGGRDGLPCFLCLLKMVQHADRAPLSAQLSASVKVCVCPCTHACVCIFASVPGDSCVER